MRGVRIDPGNDRRGTPDGCVETSARSSSHESALNPRTPPTIATSYPFLFSTHNTWSRRTEHGRATVRARVMSVKIRLMNVKIHAIELKPDLDSDSGNVYKYITHAKVTLRVRWLAHNFRISKSIPRTVYTFARKDFFHCVTIESCKVCVMIVTHALKVTENRPAGRESNSHFPDRRVKTFGAQFDNVNEFWRRQWPHT